MLKIALALPLAMLAASCAVTYTDVPYNQSQISRQVVDKTPGDGLGGALVVFEWDRRQVDIGHGASNECVRVELVRTDSDGRYKVPDWHGRMGMSRSIHRSGYARAHDPVAAATGIDKMIGGSTEFLRRTAELTRALVQCNENEDRKLLVLYEVILRDAQQVSRTAEERRLVDRHFLTPLEYSRYGAEEARRRAHQRDRER